MDKNLIDSLAVVKSSRNREKVLKSIGNDIMTPSDIAKKTDFRLNHVSLFLGELKENGLVECLNEYAKKGRLYQLTELGKQVLKMAGHGINDE